MSTYERDNAHLRSEDLYEDDDFDAYLAAALKDPEYRAAYEDATERERLLDGLVKLRKAIGLTQTEVALRMGVRQPMVSGLENEGSDPRLSTLQRYARAVEARLRLVIEMPPNCDWVSPSVSAYAPAAPVVANEATTSRSGVAKAWAACKATDDQRSVWELAA